MKQEQLWWQKIQLQQLEEGFGFDGSSIRGWAAINESDMLLIPDPVTALIDPFYETKTLVMLCNVTRSLNAMCPSFAAICLRISTRRGSASTLATWANCFAGSRFFELFAFFVDTFFVRPSLHVCTLKHVQLSLDTLRGIRKRDARPRCT